LTAKETSSSQKEQVNQLIYLLSCMLDVSLSAPFAGDPKVAGDDEVLDLKEAAIITVATTTQVPHFRDGRASSLKF
jgi:hypothetical protein